MSEASSHQLGTPFMYSARTQGTGAPLDVGVNEIVIVDPVCGRYADVDARLVRGCCQSRCLR